MTNHSEDDPSSTLTTHSRYILRSLHPLTRLGLSITILILLSGLSVAGYYMRDHLANRDGSPQFTLDDIRGAYHGVNKNAPMIRILEDGHTDPSIDKNLSDNDKQLLLEWLQGDQSQISTDFDNLDLGDAAPVEIIAANCLECHARNAKAGNSIGKDIPLEYWDDVKKIAFSKDVQPTAPAVVLASLHTHAISMAMILICTAFLAIGTRWTQSFVGLFLTLASLGLAADLASWLLARMDERFIYAIAIGGSLFALSTAILLLATLLDLWCPRCRCSYSGDASP